MRILLSGRNKIYFKHQARTKIYSSKQQLICNLDLWSVTFMVTFEKDHPTNNDQNTRLEPSNTFKLTNRFSQLHKY